MNFFEKTKFYRVKLLENLEDHLFNLTGAEHRGVSILWVEDRELTLAHGVEDLWLVGIELHILLGVELALSLLAILAL